MAPFVAGRGTACLSDSMEDYPEGIVILVCKPYRWTSADVVRKIKRCACRHFQKKNLKVGHAGTLDPLATGVLLVCVGKATRMAEELQSHDKEYVAGISFGATTPSYDLEKEIDRIYPTDRVSGDSIAEILPSFTGEQEQIAPLFSAKSVDGVRAYELARKEYRKAQKNGSGFDHALSECLSRQTVRISELELLGFWPEGREKVSPVRTEDDRRNLRINVTDNSTLHLPHAEIRIVCSKGTYVRAFARDLGEALESGAHLDSLCRTGSGSFRVEDSLSPDEAVLLFNP